MDRPDDFLALVLDVWERGFLGATVGQVLTALGIFVVALLLRRLFAHFIVETLRRLAKRSTTKIDDKVVDALDAPLRLVPVIIGVYFSLDYLEMDPQYWEIAVQFERSLIAYAIFWAIYRLVGPFSYAFDRLHELLGVTMVEWLVKALKFIIFFIGAAAILEIWGIQVGPLLAGLGLFGVAVALGAQDLFKNLIAGVLILVEKRFARGDWVLVDGVVEGTIDSIGFRSTYVRRFDKAPVYVPNAKMADNAVTNFTRMTHRRIYWKIGVEYGTTIEQLREVRDGIESYVLGNDDFAQPPEVSTFVRIDSFNDSSIDIMLYCFTKTTRWGEWLEIKEQLAYNVKEIVEGAGTGFAFPSQSIYVESLPADRPEVFVPPGQDTSQS
ncbi:MAG: mechanosensitive ion channel family protein [Alphaproteobacteria bacterium]